MPALILTSAGVAESPQLNWRWYVAEMQVIVSYSSVRRKRKEENRRIREKDKVEA